MRLNMDVSGATSLVRALTQAEVRLAEAGAYQESCAVMAARLVLMEAIDGEPVAAAEEPEVVAAKPKRGRPPKAPPAPPGLPGVSTASTEGAV